MRERAEMAGGGCRIQSLPGEGTTVEFWVPTTLQNVDVSPRSIVANGR
jgi:nitrate/nitrite-specific signal transduction histidine kinase